MIIKKIFYYFIAIIAFFFSWFSFAESDIDLANKIISSSQVVNDIKESVSPENNVSFYVDGLTATLVSNPDNVCAVISHDVIKLNDGSVISGTSSITRTSVVLDKQGNLLSVSLESPKVISKSLFDSIYNVRKLYLFNVEQPEFTINLENFSYLENIYMLTSDVKSIVFPRKGKLRELGVRSSSVYSLSNLEYQTYLYKLIMDSDIKYGYGAISNLENVECLSLALNEEILNFGRLKNLKKLDIYSPKFEDIKEIFNLKKLKNLSLWYLNDIRIQGVEFPQSIDNLSISASNNKAVPDVRGLKNLKTLRFSNIKNYHKLRVGNLPSLTKLNVKNSQLDDLSGIGQFRKLEYLDVERNSVSDISSLSNVKKLKEFHAQYNKIKDITPLFRLENLQEVDVAENKIESVFPMGRESKIKHIDYSYNPIKEVDLQSLADYPYVTFILAGTPYFENASREERTKLRNLRLKGHF